MAAPGAGGVRDRIHARARPRSPAPAIRSRSRAAPRRRSHSSARAPGDRHGSRPPRATHGHMQGSTGAPDARVHGFSFPEFYPEFYLQRETPPGAGSRPRDLIGLCRQHTKPHPQHTRKGRGDKETPTGEKEQRGRGRFIQEGNREPVSEGTHSRNCGGPRQLPNRRRFLFLREGAPLIIHSLFQSVARSGEILGCTCPASVARHCLSRRRLLRQVYYYNGDLMMKRRQRRKRVLHSHLRMSFSLSPT